MQQIDVLLFPLIPALILLHLFIAPYTKVEESFNIQAIHDISNYGIPFQNISSTLRQNYDHFDFPGAVPRTFVGALALAGVTKPIIHFAGTSHAQLIVRATLGLFNAVALLKYKSRLQTAFGSDVGRWYILLQAAQFHVIFYASRTLPNTFAFGLTTLALRELLPSLQPLTDADTAKKHRNAIFLLVVSGVVFRSEIAILIFTQLAFLLFRSQISFQTLVPAGIMSAIFALAISVPIDSYFWQKPIWPEFAGFYYNAVQGKSADWGSSPLAYYFTSSLPRLLLNPVLILLIPIAFLLPSVKRHAQDLVIPPLLFVAIYSLQPHKESRFIIYAVPPLTAAASLTASYIWRRRSKNLPYLIGALILAASIPASLVASSGMALISSLNYPGGDALTQLHIILNKTPWPENTHPDVNIRIHMDVLSCMTGVTRFQEIPWRSVAASDYPYINGRQTHLHYDKTEDPDQLLRPEFWARFDYLLMEDPEKAIGRWEVVESVFAYTGIEFLRPGDGSSFSETLEKVYAANNITKEQNGKQVAPDGQDVKDALAKGKGIDPEFKAEDEEDLDSLRAKLLLEEISKFGTYKLIRDAVRKITGGWWIGPQLEPKIRIMKRVDDAIS